MEVNKACSFPDVPPPPAISQQAPPFLGRDVRPSLLSYQITLPSHSQKQASTAKKPPGRKSFLLRVLKNESESGCVSPHQAAIKLSLNAAKFP